MAHDKLSPSRSLASNQSLEMPQRRAPANQRPPSGTCIASPLQLRGTDSYIPDPLLPSTLHPPASIRPLFLGNPVDLFVRGPPATVGVVQRRRSANGGMRALVRPLLGGSVYSRQATGHIHRLEIVLRSTCPDLQTNGHAEHAPASWTREGGHFGGVF